MRIDEVAKPKILYHGDDFGTTNLTIGLMMHERSNNQEGVGIYFSPDIEVAKSYGSKVSQISTRGLKFINSRLPVRRAVGEFGMVRLMKYLNKVNDEFWYLLSDYVEVSDQGEVRDYHFSEIYRMVGTEEIRNFQIELAQASSVKDLVEGWNRYIKIDGLYEPVSQFYSVINYNVVATPVNF